MIEKLVYSSKIIEPKSFSFANAKNLTFLKAKRVDIIMAFGNPTTY